MYADENVITIKHKVLNEVARLAFEGKLEEERDHIAGRLIPGPLPQFRCCIYTVSYTHLDVYKRQSPHTDPVCK